MRTRHNQRRDWPKRIRLRDVSLYVDVVGRGEPIVLMHGGPSADLWTMGAFRRLADQFTVVLYDHRCNGRSTGPPASTMTWDNLTADADALREHLGFERWAVLGHSFGGHVALEYALRYPERVSRLVLVDTGADARWSRENSLRVLAERSYSPAKIELVRRWFTGEFEAREYLPIFWRISGAYMPNHGFRGMAPESAPSPSCSQDAPFSRAGPSLTVSARSPPRRWSWQGARTSSSHRSASASSSKGFPGRSSPSSTRPATTPRTRCRPR